MISVAEQVDKLEYSKLCDIYRDDLEKNRKKFYSAIAEAEGIEYAKQDYYLYLKNVFFRQYRGKMFIYQNDNRYVSVVCLELFEDGMLLNSLVTVSEERRKGYAFRLLSYALDYCKSRPIYAHIYYKNIASQRLHEKLGFTLLRESAHMLDGSVRSDHFTYILK